MREPARFLPIDEAAPAPAPPRARTPRASAHKRATRPRGRIPGGKALARLNMFLEQRGMTPEPTPPAPPTVTGARAPRPAEIPAGAAPVAHSADLVAAFRATHAQLEAQPKAAQPAWRPLGPFYIPHGQTYGSGPGSRPPVAGRVSAIAIDPGNAEHVLCGSAGGGVWESTDAGRSWTPRTDNQPSLSIGALAWDPSDPQRVYAGTGEGNTAGSPTGNVRAAGLLVSDDGGSQWSAAAGSTFVGIAFFGIVVDRADGKHILAATTNGLYESKDRGATWARRRNPLTWSVSQHPPLPGNPAAGREVLAACQDGLFRSTDGGTTWSAVKLPGAPADYTDNRMAVCHAPSNGSIAYAFAAGPPLVADTAAADGSKMPKPYLWRRSTFGGAFQAVTPPPDLQTGQAWYDWFAAVAPNNPDVLYLGGINAHQGVRQASGKWSWVTISAQKAPGDSIHPDQHAIAFSPADANVVYIGCDGGLYRSPDAGAHWQTLNEGLCITEVEYLAQHPAQDAWLLVGAQDNGTIRYEGQQTWYQVADGDGGDCGVDDSDPYTCYHSYYGAYLEKSSEGGGWEQWSSTVPDQLSNEDALFYPPLEVNRALVVRGASQVWISRNAGAAWKAVPLPGVTGRPSALTAPSTSRVYVGTDQGEAFRLDLKGSTWRVTALPSPGAGFISDMLTEPGQPDHVWCSLNAGGQGSLHRSTDGGATWSSRSSGIPADVAVHALEIDGARPATLFAATDVAVMRTLDAGASWAPFGRGLPNVLVKDLLLHLPTRLLRAGTQARGVWEIPVDGAQPSAARLCIRDHAADTGRVVPTPTDVPDPFAKGTKLYWWQSPDIKIDASPFRVTGVNDLDFGVFSDDRSKVDGTIEFARGLMDERPVQGQTVRVYVQVHNLGSDDAQNVAVRVFHVRGGLTWPDLPAGFWKGFPANTPPAGSPWQAVAAATVIPLIAAGRSGIAAFEWSVPATIGNAVGLLAVASAAGVPLPTALVVSDLVRGSSSCALRNVAVLNPHPSVGPLAHASVLDVWPHPRATLLLDTPARSLVRGIIGGKAFVAAAQKAGWKEVRLSREEEEQLARLAHAQPALARQADLARAFHPPARGEALELGATRASRAGAQPLVLLFDPRATPGSGSIVLQEKSGALCGGLTIVNLAGQ